jgi:hypothetical protein
MKHFVGLDVSLKEVSICVVNAEGRPVAEGRVAAEPDRICRGSKTASALWSGSCTRTDRCPLG